MLCVGYIKMMIGIKRNYVLKGGGPLALTLFMIDLISIYWVQSHTSSLQLLQNLERRRYCNRKFYI